MFWLGQAKLRDVFVSGWIAQFLMTLIGFNWVSYTVHEFGHFPWPAAILILLLYASFANLHVALAGVLWWWLTRVLKLRPHARLWLLPVAMATMERSYPMIFDWNFGYTWLWAKVPAYQLADVVGFIGLSSIGFFFNALALKAYLGYRERSPSWWRPVVALMALFGALNVLGWWRQHTLPATDSSFKVLLTQANISNQEKLASLTGAAYRDVVLRRHDRLTKQALSSGPVDFIVWPETAFPDLISEQHLALGYAHQLKPLLHDYASVLITGGWGQTENRQLANSLFALSRDGEILDHRYDKSILLAFGEYLPLGDVFPKLKKWLPQVGDFARGPGPTVLTLNDHRVGVQICYESLFDDFTRSLSVQGAQWLVNLTNDAWYGRWQQPYQHAYVTMARAIEVRRPMVRSTNTGISSVILANGEILVESPLYEEWAQVVEVLYLRNPPLTPFTRWGHSLVPILMFIFTLLLVMREKYRLGRD
jgi:apolipoprotein N-acyltransferase